MRADQFPPRQPVSSVPGLKNHSAYRDPTPVHASSGLERARRKNVPNGYLTDSRLMIIKPVHTTAP